MTFSLVCISTGGPATLVSWIQNGEVIPENTTSYTESQQIVDTVNSIYRAELTGITSNAFLGTFECVVENSRGESRMNITLEGKSVY